MMDVVDIDPSFEPLQRVRSNTWPLPRPENYVDKDEVGGGVGSGDGGKGHDGLGGLLPGVGPLPKKNSSRRNAWGNMSYADLITQAIQSSSDKRLTLSQIYDWMVQNVPYFKDKGDSNSSAGWKNSIRHNLSLHNRFMRVQNEGTGKSSWWMINPDAKPGKAARRRATSMETQKYEKRRGRIKKKVEALRNGLLNQTQQLLHQSADATPSPCSSSLSESLDMFSDSPPEMINPGNGNGGFQLSPDFRPRASSNASSCGRLSPIPGLPDTDLNDSQVPPLSPIPWESDSLSLPQLHPVHVDGSVMVASLYGPDQLVDTLSETMKLDGCSSSTTRNGGNDAGNAISSQRQLSPLHVQGVNGRAAHLLSLLPSSTSPHSSPNSFGNLHYSNGMNASPQSMNGSGRYQDYSSNNTPSNVYQSGRNDMVKLSPQHLLVASDNNNSFSNISSLQAALSPSHSVHSLSPPGESEQVASASTSPHSSQPPQQQQQSQPSLQRSLESIAVLSPLNNSAYSCSSPGGGGGRGYRALTITSARNGVNGGECNGVSVTRNVMLNESHCGAGNEPALLRAALTPKALLLNSHSQAQGMAANSRDVLENLLMGQGGNGLGGMDCENGEEDDEDQFSTTSVSQMMGQLIAMPNDLDLNLEGGLECDVDQVINHELSHGGNLDFNFAESHASAAAAAAAAASHGRHWIVH